MRYVCSAAAIVVAVSALAPSVVLGDASNLSLTNFNLVSSQRVTRTQWYLTYQADLVNTGPAISAVTGSVTVAAGVTSAQVVQGQNKLHFSGVPANGQVTSRDTFTLLVDRTAPFSWDNL